MMPRAALRTSDGTASVELDTEGAPSRSIIVRLRFQGLTAEAPVYYDENPVRLSQHLEHAKTKPPSLEPPAWSSADSELLVRCCRGSLSTDPVNVKIDVRFELFRPVSVDPALWRAEAWMSVDLATFRAFLAELRDLERAVLGESTRL